MRFKLLRSRRLALGRQFAVHLETWRGPQGRTFKRQTLVHPGAVAILARDARGRFLMLRQFRAAVRGTLLEIPAGTLEPGERPPACARRELIEETGFAARRWRKLGAVYLAPGYSTELIHLYAAWDLHPAQGQPDADEHIRVVAMTQAQVNSAVHSGRVRDAKTLCALMLERQAVGTAVLSVEC
jgi:ADP-ribose pyrophosphatase